jgi:hypothetical protein
MIEIKNDVLHFSFPSIATEIKALLEGYIEKKLVSMIAENRETVIEQWLGMSHALNSPQEYQDKVRSVVRGLSDSDIEKLLRKKISREAETYGRMNVEFQRTLRIPDDGKTHYLPPGLGRFPLRHLEDYAESAPQKWLERGGVIMPMFQAEALWINFCAGYPCALKIASGKINAISGEAWGSGLNRTPQDYVVTSEQPWLDGFAVEKGVIRQFVAMPLGAGYSVEEQLSGKADVGGIQLQAHPMKAKSYFQKVIRPNLPKRLTDILGDVLPLYSENRFAGLGVKFCYEDMGLGAGGRMRQEIYADPYEAKDWDLEQSSRCFVHLCNAMVWRELTGENPPQPPVTAREYEKARMPWFDYYADDLAVLNGSQKLASVLSVGAVSKVKGDQIIPANESVNVPNVVPCGPKKKIVKEWTGT